MQRCALLALAVLAVGCWAQENATPAPETEEGGEQYGYGVPDYPPQQAQPAYYPPQAYGPAYAPPQYDMNYCSVHASFPLVGLKKKHFKKDHKHKENKKDEEEETDGPVGDVHGNYKRQAYGNGYAPAPAYQPAPVPAFQPAYGYPQYPPQFRPPRNHHRSFERHTCRYSAVFSQATCQTCCRIASRSVNTNAAEIFGTLFVFDPSTDGKVGANPVTQCVCCAPKKV